jgi:hypothetical protein
MRRVAAIEIDACLATRTGQGFHSENDVELVVAVHVADGH